ncbi:hypothetical protein SynBMKMC1_00268 [Synechococcus sp. BMK-MC-1]|nr:hypothetical protein SynBMKMC1_00268 [Synechococcus sp. BMK-MC-1]
MLDGHLPDAGNGHHAWAYTQQPSGIDAQPWIIEEPPEHYLGVEQQAHQVLNS